MKTTRKLLVVVMLLLIVFGGPSPAYAGGGLGFNFRGPTAFASFLNAEGCTVTDVMVIASENRIQDSPGSPTNVSFASVTIYQYDSCTGTTLLYASGTTNPLSKGELQISKTLGTATLNTTVSVFDEISETNLDLDVSLSWTATGPLTRDKDNVQIHTPGCITNSHFRGRTRIAEAWGNVSAGSTNFTPGTSVRSTYLTSVHSGIVTIGCN